jgi:transposase
MVRQGKSVSEVARYFGYSKGAVSKWYKKYPLGGAWVVPTLSSRPKSHPRALPFELVDTIIAYRKKYNRCAEVTHAHLKQDSISVSLSSVKRKLDRAGLTKKKSPWKRLHLSSKRPPVASAGDLIMVDTIPLQRSESMCIP